MLYVNATTQKERLLARGDNKKESVRRIIADANDFVGIEYNVDCIVDNSVSVEPSVIAKKIHSKYVESKKKKKKI